MKSEFVGLITGGRWHLEAYQILKKNKKKIIVFDDSKNFYLKKFLKKTDAIFKIAEIKKIKKSLNNNIFFWSPINDYGSLIADRFNHPTYKNKIRTPINLKKINKEIIKKKLLLKRIKVPKKIKPEEYGLLKKIDGSGSREIYLTKKNKKNFIKEEYIKGIEISVETISYNYNHTIIATSLRILANYKSAECILLLEMKKNYDSILYKKIKKILDALNIINGACHIELILNDKNELIPIDCNLRAGGSAISSIFLKKVIKINLLELDYLSLTGERPLRIGKLNGYGAIFYYSSINKKIKKNKLSKNCYHENLKGNDTKNKNNDLGRKSLIIIENSKKEKFFKEFKKYIKEDNYNLIIKNWQLLNNLLF